MSVGKPMLIHHPWTYIHHGTARYNCKIREGLLGRLTSRDAVEGKTPPCSWIKSRGMLGRAQLEPLSFVSSTRLFYYWANSKLLCEQPAKKVSVGEGRRMSFRLIQICLSSAHPMALGGSLSMSLSINSYGFWVTLILA